jgi:hypothetical protein
MLSTLFQPNQPAPQVNQTQAVAHGNPLSPSRRIDVPEFSICFFNAAAAAFNSLEGRLRFRQQSTACEWLR